MRRLDALKTYKELEEAKQRIKQLERNIDLLWERCDCADIFEVEAILRGEEKEAKP